MLPELRLADPPFAQTDVACWPISEVAARLIEASSLGIADWICHIVARARRKGPINRHYPRISARAKSLGIFHQLPAGCPITACTCFGSASPISFEPASLPTMVRRVLMNRGPLAECPHLVGVNGTRRYGGMT
jgi:hypothetical protein